MAAQVPSRKYRIERYLAEGGMGAIYVGKKIGPGGFEKEVVLKQLLPEFTSRPEFRDLFFREAKISATLDHQNVVRTFDLVNSNGRLFIVMEYVRGADLRTIAWRARRRKPLSPQAILHVAMEILAGLGYAHSRRSPTGEPLGIIHRDLSPSNILCSGEGEVKLSDFGIAKAVTYSSVFYRVRGKVGYMSPEMARNQPIDARSDLFSMGVSIYETFIGERIYTGDLNTPPDRIYAQTVPPLESKCPGLPPELQGALDRALAIDPNDRYPDAESFAQAIRQVAISHGLLYSAPELAAELREIMGPNADVWLSDQRDPTQGRSVRNPQVAGGLAGEEADSLVEPSDSSGAAHSSSVEDSATPPARLSTTLSSATSRSSGQMPATTTAGTSRSSGQMSAASARSSGQMPAMTGRSGLLQQARSSGSLMAASASASAPDEEQVTPPPPVPLPLPKADDARPARRFGLSPSARPVGGVAASRRSRRGLWLALLVLLAILVGFLFVRFVIGPTAERPGGSEDGAGPRADARGVARGRPWKA
jgi:serine/threonine protein kinase